MNEYGQIKQYLGLHIRIIIGVVIILAAIGAVWYVMWNAPPTLNSYSVQKGNVISSVDIPGTVSSSNSVDLSFQESGQIATVNVENGDSVTQGQVLAYLDDSTQQTTLAAAQANYQKLLAGATTENIQTSKDAVNSAQQNLTNAYSGAMNTLNNSYTALYNAYNMAVSMQKEYFTTQDTEGIAVSIAKNDINTTMQSAQNSLTVAQKSMAPSDIDLAVTQVLSSLNSTYNDISSIRTQCDQGVYYYSVAAADKASLDTQKTTLNTVLNNATSLQQNLASLKLSLQTAQDQLGVTTAPPTQADINLAKSQIDNAQLMIDHSTIVAPFSGIIRNVIGQVGMVVSPNVPVLSIINNGILKIDAYGSETDVPQIQANALANVTLDAYGNSVSFPAKVSAVDTAQTVINGSPAYHVTLYFTNPDDRIRVGMTGNIMITATEHDNVIQIPSRLVLNNNGNSFVRMQDGAMRQITLGLTDSNGMVEIISGLQEGDKISNF